ncbi:glycosyl hydrolase [Planotetraspora sp. A-T 1434]|uniref:glycoside hydrolase family 26 protein n=1 Tax=Planotetraspora sp. A-T 1434 TaxID=2979219 RepID=UPI0021C0F798|nr:glycosyl hydrolase [Planotetraspora sp. A-T 1434]MCT9933786.1 glycosyl hydrolase [Planotetraspora sp. A-T 1434]
MIQSRAARLGLALVLSLTVALTGCSSKAEESALRRSTGAAPDETFIPYDVRPLIKPSRKYLGVAIDGAPKSMAPIEAFAANVGKRPNLIEFYAAWGDQYETTRVRNAWDSGALPLIAWEPFKPSLAAIARGDSDAYIRKFADDVRNLNLPVGISFGHEMNTFWYPWGTSDNEPTDFVGAWRRVHDLFAESGATNVIWVWSPNVINPVPTVALRPYYPGDSYIDWVGVIGYYTRTGAHTFAALYGPTVRQVRKFSRKPFLIQETGSEPGPRKRRDVADLLAGVAGSRSFLGFVWFNFKKRADWRIETDPEAVALFRRGAADQRLGFDVRAP